MGCLPPCTTTPVALLRKAGRDAAGQDAHSTGRLPAVPGVGFRASVGLVDSPVADVVVAVPKPLAGDLCSQGKKGWTPLEQISPRSPGAYLSSEVSTTRHFTSQWLSCQTESVRMLPHFCENMNTYEQADCD